MPNIFNVGGFDVARRFDGSYAIYDYGWWPDEELDNDPLQLEWYLARTEGWRAKGWQVVHVTASPAEARAWCMRNSAI